MTNKNIALRIKALLSQNKHLRQKIKTLKKERDIVFEVLQQERRFWRERYFIDKATIIQQREVIKRVSRQRNYYNRMVHDLHYKIKMLKEANIFGEVNYVIEDVSKKKR